MERTREFILKQVSLNKNKEEIISEILDMKFFLIREDNKFLKEGIKESVTNWYNIWTSQKK